jgi:hypothetical protein
MPVTTNMPVTTMPVTTTAQKPYRVSSAMPKGSLAYLNSMG